MNKKQIFLSICLFIVFFSLLSVASASDTSGNVTVTAVSDDSNAISVTNNQDYNLGASPGSFKNLNDTITGSHAGDTIPLEIDFTYSSEDGNFSEGILIDKDITLDGQGSTINAQGNASIFNIQGNPKVILKNIKFINAVGVNGSAIKLGSSAQLEIINCNFNNNVAQMCGGAIYVSDSSSLTSNLIINGSTFNGNSARFGGAIYWTGDHGVLIDSKFTRNSASQDGGAIYWEGHNGLINGSTFEYNSVSGVLNSDKNVTRHNDDTGIDEIHFDILGGDGGAIIWKGSDAIIEGSTFNKNSAPYRGGAIFFTGMEGENCTNVTIKNANFNENYAAMNGGAIDWATGASNATIIGSYFIKNVADRSAGAIYVRGDGLEVKDSEFKNNKLTGNTLYDNRTDGMTFTSIGGNGGAICWMGSYGTVDNVIFTDNVASQRGGAIQFERNVNGTVKNSRFTGNRAGTEGGAIDFYNGAENGKIINSNFTNNIAGENGGAIYWQGHYGTINGSRFENNKAIGLGDGVSISNTTNPNTNASEERFNITGGDGGAIKWTGSHGIIENTVFYKNTASYSGGALYLTGNATENCTNITFVDCNFIQNTANLNGGALNWASGSSNATLIGSYFSRNTAKRSAGAIYISGNYLNIKDTKFESNAATKEVTYDNRADSAAFASLGGNAGAICWMGSYGTVDNGTFIKNTAQDRGGAIQFERNENGTVKNSYFEQNSAKGDGGAIDWYHGAVNGQLINSTFKSNIIVTGFDGSGAGVYIEGYNATIRDSKFYSHTADSDGAALYVAGDDCKVFDSIFNGNTAGDDGGAIYWEGDNGFVHNITCVNNKGISKTKPDGVNTSSTRGGTLSIIGNNVTVEKSTFKTSRASMTAGKNSSKVDGGAIFITGNDVSIIDTSFNDCSAVHAGGAFYVIGNDTRIINCTITKTSAENGGAVYIEGHNITISELTSSSSTATTRGGSIYVEGYGAYIDNSVFTSNEGLIGGAIYIAGDDVVVDNSTFKSNKGKGKVATDGGSGGAVYIDGEGATISGSDFDSNYAIRYGGAIAVWGAGANITSNSFKNSHVNEFDGGAIFVKGLNATISKSNFSSNKASAGKGGAIGVQGSNTHILGCNFTDSVAKWGGIIHVDGFASVIEDSNFTNSHATEGGAIYLNGLNASILNSDFSKVYASTYGGAINVAGDYANISGCEFDTCTVNSNGARGGAIYIAGLDTNIEDSNFTSCKASGTGARGGAIDIEGHNTHVTDSIFEKCTAPNGGDIFVFGNNVKMQDSIFDSSTATNGGAIYIWGWGAVVENSNLTNCNASASGGAIYTTQSGGTSILSNNFDSCYAKGTPSSQGGGAIYVEGPNTHISDSNFTNNKATSGAARGGAIYIKGNETIVEKSYFNNSIANQGGVIHIEGENAIIDSSVFANSSSRGSGGAISVLGNNAAIENSQFENFKASPFGGAIYVNGKDTQILYSSFDNCTTTGNNNKGGVIYIDNVGTNVWYSNFTNSKANTAGAIYINGKDTVISYCNLDNNTAHTAGAISVHGNDTILSNNNFTNNIATSGSGGALDIGGDNASVYYSWFDKNRASGNGGAINWDGGHGSDSIIGSTFTNNDCNNTQQGGGAIFWTAGEIGHIGAGGLIQDSIFVNNTANGRHGGAINWYHAKDSVINNCLFVNNTAASDGGALYTGHQTGGGFNLTMTNCQFYNNTARKHGGAIANQMESSWIYNNTFDGNKAEASGGSILMKEGFAINSVIDHCYIYNSYVNQSYGAYGEGGGAIRIEDDNITITNSAIINSVANSTYGGAIYVKSTNASLINVTIQNVATLNDNGGAIYWDGVNGYMKNVTIFNSSSNSIGDKDANGGAIYLLANNCNFTDISIASSSSNNPNNGSSKSANGGAIYVFGTGNVITNLTIDNVESSSANFKSDGGAIYWAGSSGSLINASISNTLANGEGGAIYWSGTSATVDNISIEYSQTNVTNSTKDANGGAIYSTGIEELTNVIIVDALASTDDGDIRGGAIYFANGKNMTNVTVIGSRVSTGNGTSYGGAIYWKNDIGDAFINESSFVNNTADLGGAVYVDNTNVNVNDTLFAGNVADKGGAFYGKSKADVFDNVSFIENKARSNGGAIYTENAVLKMNESSLTGNRAEQNGGAICHNSTSASDSSMIKNTNLTDNVAYKGSAIYTNNFFDLTNSILLDNQANANKFINKIAGTNNVTGENFTSAIFVGNDNLLNAIWVNQNEKTGNCTNVTYLGSTGVVTFSGIPDKNDQDTCQNITVEVYDDDGNFLQKGTVRTDASGAFNYTFQGKPGITYNFAYIHESDAYYTYLRDTYSNRSIVKVNVNDFYWGNSTTMYISLNDGAMGGLNGTVKVTFNDPNHTSLIINVTDGIYRGNHTFPFDVGTYNVSAVFAGDLNHTGDVDWNLTHVLPFDDVAIIKEVNITADYVNVTDIVKYTITVTNHGPTKATGVNVTEILTPYLKLLNCTVTRGNYNFTEGKWYMGDVGVDEIITMTIIAQVIHVGTITNTVWVNSNGWDTNPSNDISPAHNFTALPIVDLAITKKVNVTEILNVTDKIKYTIEVYNYGPCNATGVVIGEVLDPRLQMISSNPSVGKYENGTWNIGEMANGTNATLTIVAQVAYSGTILNKVNVTSFETDTNMSNNEYNVTNYAEANVDLQITKKANVTGLVKIGDKIKFTISIYNAGPANASGVYVGEEIKWPLRLISSNVTIGKFDGSTWIIGSLIKGEVHNLTIVAEVADIGNVTNYVFINGSDNDTNLTNNYANITNITVESPFVDVSIVKEVNVSSVKIGDLIKFTITVHNAGPANATGVYVKESLSPYLKLWSNQTSVSKWDGNTWVIGNLTCNSTETLIIVAEVASEGVISNAVNVTSNETDTNMSNNHDEIDNITVSSLVDVAITKYLMNNTAYVGENIVYYISVENKGPAKATGVIVHEKISELVEVVEASDSNYDKTTNVWNIGNLTKGESKLLKLTVKIRDEGTIRNSVNVTSNENDTNMSNNNASSSNITVIKKAEFEIIKTSNLTGDAYVGDLVNFTITFTNKGPSNATEVVITDELPEGLTYFDSGSKFGDKGMKFVVGGKEYVTWNAVDMAVGEGSSVWVVVKAITNGTFVNVATVVPKEYNSSSKNETNITVLPVADLEIVKKAISPDVVYVGDEIVFTVDVHNKGPSNATGVVVNETVTGLVEIINFTASVGTAYDPVAGIWTIGNLTSGGDAGLVILAKVISNGTVENFVSVKGNEKDFNMSNNNASSKNVTALPLVDVKVNKTVSVTEAKVGDEIVYTIKVQNNGPNDATNVNVTGKLSDNVVFVKYTASKGSYFSSENVWYIGKLTNGSIATLTLTVKATHVGTVENSVIVNSTEKDSNLTNNNYTCENVTVTKLDTPIELNTYNITYGEDEILRVELPENATGTVNITVGNRTYDNVPINGGKVELPVSDLAGGDYNVTVVYGGDDKYNGNSTSGIFNVAPLTPIITIEVEDIWVWEIEVLNVTVNAPGTVFVTVYGITVEIPLNNGVVTTDVLKATAKPDYKGNATWNIINLPAGTYPAFALYPGNENYTSVNTSDVFIVRDLIPTNVIVTADDIYVGDDAVINVVVGPEGVTGNVTVNVDGKNYTVPLDDGKAILVVPGLKAGEKDVTVWYEGNRPYLPSENTTTFNVLKYKPPVDIDAPEITVGEDGVIIVTVPDDATGTITIEIDGKRYTEPIEDGEAVFIIPGLKVGVHDIIAFYSGDDTYLPANTTGEIKVNPKDEPDDHNKTPKKSTIDNKMHATGNPIMALIAVLMSICLVQTRRFKK